MAFLCVSFISAFEPAQDLAPVGEAAGASGYEYNILNEQCDLYVTKGGGGHIEYLITVQNLGPTLNGLDIRMPNSRYSLDTAVASINGMTIPSDRIEDSDSVTGIRLDFGANAIATNYVGTIYLKVWDPVVALKDDEYGGYSAIVLTPAWFPSDENDLTTALRLSIHLPENISTEDIYPKGETYDDLGPDAQDRTTATWELSNVRWSVSGPKTKMGITLPDKYVEAHSKFWSITVLGAGPILVIVIVAIVILLAGIGIAAFFIGRRMGAKPPYKRPLLVKGVSLIDHSLTPSSVAYIARSNPEKVLALQLLQSAKAGAVKVRTTGDGLRYEVLRSDGTPFTRLSGQQLDPEAVAEFFDTLEKGLCKRSASFDLKKGLDGFGPRVGMGWDAVKGAKGYLPELRAVDRNIIWMLADEEFGDKWVEFARDRKELTVPLWLYRLMFERPPERIKGVGPPQDKGFASLIWSAGGPKGVTVRTKELTKGLVGLTDRLSGEFLRQDKVKAALGASPVFEVPSKRKHSLTSLPASNKGAYQRFGGGA